MSTALAPKIPRASFKKGVSALKFSKKITDKSTLEVLEVNSEDFEEQIGEHLKKSYRFRKLANEVVKINSAWLVHNRKLEAEFAKTRKRFQCGGKAHNVGVSYGFLFTKDWKIVEKLASEGLKTGNLEDTWLGNPKDAVVLSQCPDIGLAYMTGSESKAAESYIDEASVSREKDNRTFYVVLVRWLRGKSYVTTVTPPDSPEGGTRLDPQPNHVCHITNWNRTEALDPKSTSLNTLFHDSQIYLYEYDDEMELKSTLNHVIPSAVIKCQWNITPGVVAQFTAPEDGAILLPDRTRKLKSSSTSSAAARKSLLSTPPPSMKIPLEFNGAMPAHMRGTGARALFKNPAAPLPPGRLGPGVSSPPPPMSAPPASAPYDWLPPPPSIPQPSRRVIASSRQPTAFGRTSPPTEVYPSTPSDPSIAAGRVLQQNLNGDYLQSCVVTVDGSSDCLDDPVWHVVNSCYLVWPTYGASEGVGKVAKWQFPVQIMTLGNPVAQSYEGLMQPRYVISELVQTSRLHYELAGLQPPEPPASKETLSSDCVPVVSDPRRTRSSTVRKSVSPSAATEKVIPPPPPFYVNCLEEWTVPGGNSSAENGSGVAAKSSSRFAGFRGNYFLLSLPDSYSQRTAVENLCEKLRSQKQACFVRMPCSNGNGTFCMFPESDFSRSIGIPSLDPSDTTSLHGILLLPHSMHPSLMDRCICQSAQDFDTADRDEIDWSYSIKSMVKALPNGGADLSRFYSNYPDSVDSPEVCIDLGAGFEAASTPMSPQEQQRPFSFANKAPIVIPVPESPMKTATTTVGEASAPASPNPQTSVDMELETSFESNNVPSSPDRISSAVNNTVPTIPLDTSPTDLPTRSLSLGGFLSNMSVLQVPEPEPRPSTRKRNRSRSPPRFHDGEEEGEIVDDEDDDEVVDEYNRDEEIEVEEEEEHESCSRQSSVDSRSKRVRRDSSSTSSSSRHRHDRRSHRYYNNRPPKEASPPPSSVKRDVDYRRPNQFRDTDYRYEVYQPKSLRADPVPVEVIDYGRQQGRGFSQLSRYESSRSRPSPVSYRPPARRGEGLLGEPVRMGHQRSINGQSGRHSRSGSSCSSLGGGYRGSM